jgi:hypothetical protein
LAAAHDLHQLHIAQPQIARERLHLEAGVRFREATPRQPRWRRASLPARLAWTGSRCRLHRKAAT